MLQFGSLSEIIAFLQKASLQSKTKTELRLRNPAAVADGANNETDISLFLSSSSFTAESTPMQAPRPEAAPRFAVEPWFAGAIGRRACEAKVLAGGHRSFLIRESSQSVFFVSLTFAEGPL